MKRTCDKALMAPVEVLLIASLRQPGVILIANTVAFWPGQAAARLNPAEALRAE
jgi:hypothetical protein